MDAGTEYHRDDLDHPLSDHHRQLRLRIHPGVQQESAVVGDSAFRHQPRGEPDLHADSVRASRPDAGSGRHPGRVGHDTVVHDEYLAALSLGGSGTGAVLDLGLPRHDSATLDHLGELGEMMLLGLLPFRPFCF